VTPDAQLTVTAVVATLRYASNWLDNEAESQMLLDTADHIEQHGSDLPGSLSCPMCEEVRCDEDCPLASIRRRS
jgi:hypothetical protein